MNPRSFAALKLSLCVVGIGLIASFGELPAHAASEPLPEDYFSKDWGLLPMDELKGILAGDSLAVDDYDRLIKLVGETGYHNLKMASGARMAAVERAQKESLPSRTHVQQTALLLTELERDLIQQRRLVVDWVIKGIESGKGNQKSVFSLYRELFSLGSEEETVRLSTVLPHILAMKNSDVEGAGYIAVSCLNRKNLLSKPMPGIPQKEILDTLAVRMGAEIKQAALISFRPTLNRDLIIGTRSPLGKKLLGEQLAAVQNGSYTELMDVGYAIQNYASAPYPELFDEIIRISKIVSLRNEGQLYKFYFANIRALTLSLKNAGRLEQYEKLVNYLEGSKAAGANAEWIQRCETLLYELKTQK